MLLLLHEGLGCIDLWRTFPARLADLTRCSVFLYSRLGYGQSDKAVLPRPIDYMRREALESLPRIIDTVAVDRSVVLIGHSDGASIAALYAGLADDPRIAALVLIAPHFFAETLGLDSIREARVAYQSGTLRASLERYHRHVDNAFRGWNDAWLDEAFRHWNIESCLDTISVPTLAIQGTLDQYGTAAQIDVIQARLGALASPLWLKDCRHSPHLERADEVLGAIDRFVGTIADTDDR